MPYNVYFRPHTNKDIDWGLTQLKCNINKYGKNINIVNNITLADIQIVQIYELSDIVYIENGNILLYFYFKPCIEEINYLNDLIQINNNITIASVFDSFSSFNGTYTKLLWGVDIPKLHTEENISSIRIAKHTSIDTFNPKNKDIILDNYKNLSEITYNDKYHYIICESSWIDTFNFSIINCLNKGSIPIINDSCIDYRQLYITLETFNDSIDSSNVNLTIPSYLKWGNIIPLYESLFDQSFIQTNSIKDDYLFLPLLDVINSEQLQCSSFEECLSKCKDDWNCITSDNILKVACPWNIIKCYNNISEGIYVKKNKYTDVNLPNYRNDYHIYPYLNYEKYDINSKNINSKNIVGYTSNKKFKMAIATPDTWNYSSDNCIYLKKIKYKYPLSLVTYVDSPDDLLLLIKNINIIVKELSIPIEIFYRSDILDMSDIIENETIIIYDISKDILDEHLSDNSNNYEKLLSIYLSKAKTIIFFQPTVLFFETININNIIDNNETCILFERFKKDTKYEDSIKNLKKNVSSWSKIVSNLITTSYQITTDDCFIFNRETNLINLLIALGVVYDGINISLSDIIQISMLSTNSRYTVISQYNNFISLGLPVNQFFIGFNGIKSKILSFIKIPIWVRESMFTHIVDSVNYKHCFYESRLDSVITDSNKSKEINNSEICDLDNLSDNMVYYKYINDFLSIDI